MLDTFRKGQRWLSLIFVSVIGLVFVFFLGVGGGSGPGTPTGNAILQLDDVKLTSRDFEREKANMEGRLRQQLGDSYDQVVASGFIESQALGTMINALVLSAAAEDIGLRVTQDELRRFVQSSPIFVDADGQFSPEAYTRFAEYEYGSERAFIRSFTRTLLGQKLVQLLAGQSVLSDSAVDLRTQYDLDESRIAYVAIDPSRLPIDFELADADVEAYSADHEDELRAAFAERSAEFGEPEQVRARHFLILATPGANSEKEESARERAEAGRLRIEEGEDFATVAREISEDIGTVKEGGDLGLFARGNNDPAFDEAAFALETGEVSQVIRSTYGFHVIQVDEKLANRPGDFDEQRLNLAREAVSKSMALENANQTTERLTQAIKSGETLEDAARAAGITLERPPGLRRRTDGFIPGLGAAGDVLTTAFILGAGESSPVPFEIGERRILIQVLERNAPSEESVASERPERRERAEAEIGNRVLQAWINEYRGQLETSGRLLINAELALGS